MLIDSHCHLDAAEFDTDRAQQVALCESLGLCAVVVPAVGRSNFEQVIELADRHPLVFFTLGIHPMYVEQAELADLDRLERLVELHLANPKFVGIGEIGLDHFVPDGDRARQTMFFEQQLRLAVAHGLPVILHVRRAVDAVLKALRRFRPMSGIAHAFNGSAQQAAVFESLGFALGFGGAMTFTRALQIRRLATSLSLDSMVLETDAPDIAPAWLSGARNSPSELPQIAQSLAQLRGCEPEACIRHTGRTVLRVLPRLAGALARPLD